MNRPMLAGFPLARPRGHVFASGAGGLLVLAIWMCGCSENGGPSGRAADPGTAPLYGEPKGTAAQEIGPARPHLKNASWTNASFWILQTELSPATLIHSESEYLGVFTGMPGLGLGAPSHLAFSTRSGPRSFTNGATLDVTIMEENWVLVWFAGAPGWTDWDSPWAVFLQRRPRSMHLDAEGLHLEFPAAAGEVVLMPIYGSYQTPLGTNRFPVPREFNRKQIDTSRWGQGLRTEPLMRVRYWASATREFPIYCEDTFSVDRSRDSVTIRQQFTWHTIDDDWRTRHLKVAPVSPPLGLASRDRDFPVRFSKPPMDYRILTPYGPYLGIEGVDGFDATFPLLRYVHETEALDPPDINAHPVTDAALRKLQTTARAKFHRADRYDYDHGGLSNFCWAIQGDRWYAKALPYYDETTRSNALGSLRKYFREDVLVTNRFELREYPDDSGRHYFILKGPPAGSGDTPGDAGRFSAGLLETLWAYAHFTGDWDLVNERWPIVQKLFTTGAGTRWAGFGRDAVVEMGDEAAPCVAMARLAYRVGDMDTYHYACYLFVRELVHHWLKQRGAEYFREHQPYNSMEAMPEEVYLTHLPSGKAGWHIDGPDFPSQAGQRQYRHRWVRFSDLDVARFHRDFLKADSEIELDRLLTRWPRERRFANDSHRLPSLVQLRSLLLNESPEKLAVLAIPGQFTGPPSGMIASCLAMIRTSHPTRLERLIPGGEPSPFICGLEREVAGPNPFLVQDMRQRPVETIAATPTSSWPLVIGSNWKTSAGLPWNVGRVRARRMGEPIETRRLALNWNSVVVTWTLP